MAKTERGWLTHLFRCIKRWYFKLLRLLFYSKEPEHFLSLGVAFGLFWGLTPTVGLQITCLAVHKAVTVFVCKKAERLKFLNFNLPIAIIMTWVSNPPDAPFLYFGYYATGVLVTPGMKLMTMDKFLELFRPVLDEGITAVPTFLNSQLELVVYPMLYGSLIIAIPSAIGGYFAARSLIRRHKQKKEAELHRRINAKSEEAS